MVANNEEREVGQVPLPIATSKSPITSKSQRLPPTTHPVGVGKCTPLTLAFSWISLGRITGFVPWWLVVVLVADEPTREYFRGGGAPLGLFVWEYEEGGGGGGGGGRDRQGMTSSGGTRGGLAS